MQGIGNSEIIESGIIFKPLSLKSQPLILWLDPIATFWLRLEVLDLGLLFDGVDDFCWSGCVFLWDHSGGA